MQISSTTLTCLTDLAENPVIKEILIKTDGDLGYRLQGSTLTEALLTVAQSQIDIGDRESARGIFEEVTQRAASLLVYAPPRTECDAKLLLLNLVEGLVGAGQIDRADSLARVILEYPLVNRDTIVTSMIQGLVNLTPNRSQDQKSN